MYACVLQRLRIHSCDSNPVTEDPKMIQIHDRRVPIHQAIRRSTHEIVRRSVPVHAVQTWWQFRPETVLFHVSICSCIIFLFIIVSSINMLPISFHVTVWFILPLWLCVSLYETSVGVHLIYLVDMSVYQYHFMCKGLPLFKTSCNIP